ncbi:uncharacterized protein M6B38_185250 [Iris pallida]|uniref:FHA domain-containing protein n=1 Tax=Iris pallida TaxID=29817 RepID=A0AAX6EM38_IRIPA|nr:uncharacterized protein M6B38_185250 [Iris pallida]
MEVAMASSFAFTSILPPKPLLSLLPLSKLPVPGLSSKKPSRKQPLLLHITTTRKVRSSSTSLRSSSTSSTSDSSERWLLEPVGDGDSSHIGFKVPLPSAIEIASDVVTVGRVPGKADMVIPVATVSGLHARLEKKEGKLFVTDLESTNGTFIDERRLRPGATASVSPGNCITFVGDDSSYFAGDMNLAIFRVSKVEAAPVESPASEPEKSDTKVDAVAADVNLESAG